MKKFNISITIMLLFCELFSISSADLPSDVQKCKSTDNDECIRKTTEDILRRYPKGNPSFGMPNVSALDMKNVKVSRSNANSPIQINFEFLKCTVYGVESTKILKASGFDKDFKNVQMDVFTPLMQLKGDYEMSGKLLLLPLNGKGIGAVDLYETNMTFRGQMEKQQRNNKTYLQIKKLKTVVQPKKLIANLENVFNGNPILSQTINEVINENWKDVWAELQEGINHALEIIIRRIGNEIFKEVSVEEMYLD